MATAINKIKSKKWNSFWDIFGIGTSLICLIHCLMFPVFLLILPTVDIPIDHEFFHLIFYAVAILAAVFSFFICSHKIKDKKIHLAAYLGILLLTLGTFFIGNHEVEAIFIISGCGFLLYGHLIKFKIRQKIDLNSQLR